MAQSFERSMGMDDDELRRRLDALDTRALVTDARGIALRIMVEALLRQSADPNAAAEFIDHALLRLEAAFAGSAPNPQVARRVHAELEVVQRNLRADRTPHQPIE